MLSFACITIFVRVFRTSQPLFSAMESKAAAGKVTSEELAAIEDEEVLNKMVSQ